MATWTRVRNGWVLGMMRVQYIFNSRAAVPKDTAGRTRSLNDLLLLSRVKCCLQGNMVCKASFTLKLHD